MGTELGDFAVSVLPSFGGTVGKATMMSRRWVALLAVMFTTADVTASAPPASAFATSADHRTGSGPPSISPADIRFAHRVLRIGRAHQVGLLPEQVQRMRVDLERYLTPAPDHPRHPVYAGAVLLAAKQGVIVQRVAVGMAMRYSAVGPPPDRVGVELPLEQQIPTRPDTIFDIASITKVFTTIAVLQQVEAGRVALDAPVADYVPEFAAGGKQAVTVRMLLTHTSGLPAWVPLWRYPTPAERLTAALATPLRRGATPGGQYEYSDLGYIALGALVERITGRRLDEVVRTGITGPLSMTETGYNPGPDLRVRIAATEYQTDPARGMVWGEVHDENAWSLGGVAGHAGSSPPPTTWPSCARPCSTAGSTAAGASFRRRPSG
jgi:CubicO group peptidase (beta-lactamase class C family)